MSLYFGLIMFLCIVPTLILCFYQIYPGTWQEKKLVLGVRNREEFREGETAGAVDAIYQKYRAMARIIMIVGCIISALLLLLHGMALQTTLWMSFILLAILAINLPFLLGNREMKDLKRRLGLKDEAGVSFVDLSNAGSVRTLKPWQVLLPNLAGLVMLVIVLLLDLRVIRIETRAAVGSFLGTGIMGTCVAMGLLIAGCAFLMDGLRNEVISADSAVNANYNRAKKKNYADFFVKFMWVNVIFMVGFAVMTVLFYSEMLCMVSLAIYLILVMAGLAVFISREKRIEARWQKEVTLLSDDDDNWIGGMFYYNPRDKRLNVEKRVGMGGTINLAHPAGKALSGFFALCLLFTVLSVVWICMIESTPLRLSVEDGKVICHQLRDEYVIDLDDALSVEWGEDTGSLRLVRISGVGMESLLKGNFTVNGENGCKVFLATEAGKYIKIVTKDRVYYVSGATAQETEAAYEAMQPAK